MQRIVRLIENIEQKSLLMARPGRPRINLNLERKFLTEMSEDSAQLQAIIQAKIAKHTGNSPYILMFEAAYLLLAIERGASLKDIRSTAIFEKIRQYAGAHGWHGKRRDARDFLEEFVRYYSPGWDWRKEADEGEVEDLNYERDNERLAKMHADDARWGIALRSKSYAPDVPDDRQLLGLAWDWRSKKSTRKKSGWKQQRFIRRTWPHSAGIETRNGNSRAHTQKDHREPAAEKGRSRQRTSSQIQ